MKVRPANAIRTLYLRGSSGATARASREIRLNIGYRLQLLQDELAGDVKKLEGQRSHYRLRAGRYRILFRLDDEKD